MWNDEIVEEVRKVRQAHAAAHAHDLKSIVRDLVLKQQTSGRQVVTLSPRAPASPVVRRTSSAGER